MATSGNPKFFLGTDSAPHLKNDKETEKKLKSFKKDLSNQFTSKIAQLKELALDQDKFNSIIFSTPFFPIIIGTPA